LGVSCKWINDDKKRIAIEKKVERKLNESKIEKQNSQILNLLQKESSKLVFKKRTLNKNKSHLLAGLRKRNVFIAKKLNKEL
jgi:hypothetical protein